MALDPSIILSGQPVNMLGILDASNRMAGEQKDRLHTQGYRNMLATNGAGIMAGDQNALNALAGFDPTAALGVKNTRQEMDFSQQKMGILNAQERRAAEQYAMGLSADQRAAEAKQIEDAVKMGLAIQDAATWDQTMAQMAPDLVGQFGNRQALAARFMEFSDVMKMAFPEPPKPLSKEGKLQADINAGLLPEGTVSAPDTVINMGADKFAEEFAKGDAATIGTVYDAGLSATRNLGRIDQLEAVLQESPSGLAAFAAQKAGEWGINTQGLDAIQAAQAMINSLVPEQRQPGSGPMSDADLELFKQSLPRLINQPGGNKIIIDTMRAVAQYDAEGAMIVQMLRSGKLDRAQAFQMLQDRQNPLAAFSAGGSDSPAAAPSLEAPATEMPQITDKAAFDALPSGAEFIAPDGSRRRKP